jgi:hypothetical protein
MSLPWTDWQFWVVTVVAGWAGWVVVRPFLPRRKERETPCDHCAVGTAARARLSDREENSGSS